MLYFEWEAICIFKLNYEFLFKTFTSLECNDGFFGEMCQHSCPSECKDNVCQRYSGLCTECNPFSYGSNCDLKCPNCKEGNCDMDDGSCLKGCKSTLYGDLCNDQCSDKCNDRLCLNNGTCTGKQQGCKFTTSKLWKDCSKRFFGTQCHNMYPYRRSWIICDTETGHCFCILSMLLKLFSCQCSY